MATQTLDWKTLLCAGGCCLPWDYLVLDCETTCFGNGILPLEIGHTLVQGGHIATRRAYYLDWTRSPYVDEEWLRDQLAAVKKYVENDDNGEPTGHHWHITYELLRDEGKPVPQVLRYYLDLVQRLQSRKFSFVGHNFKFDTELLSNTWSEFLAGETFEFPAQTTWDTGTILKAVQMQPPLPVKPGEDILKYLARVKYAKAPGLKWNLTQGLKLLGLVDKYQLDTDKLHGAGYDAYATHLLFEELRQLFKEE